MRPLPLLIISVILAGYFFALERQKPDPANSHPQGIFDFKDINYQVFEGEKPGFRLRAPSAAFPTQNKIVFNQGLDLEIPKNSGQILRVHGGKGEVLLEGKATQANFIDAMQMKTLNIWNEVYGDDGQIRFYTDRASYDIVKKIVSSDSYTRIFSDNFIMESDRATYNIETELIHLQKGIRGKYIPNK